MQCPTCVNNVETLCCVTRVLDKGAAWFAEMGSKGSSGTKLLSISGDCQSPGVYEFPFGTSIREILAEAGATDTLAVQVGGPSGQMIAGEDFDRTICYDDLATGGSIMIFSRQRNILEVVSYFMEFFVEESCGYCTPCRVGNVLLKKCIDDILEGNGKLSDFDYLKELGEIIKTASRCGLGQTSPNPVLTSLQNFRSIYEAQLKEVKDDFLPSFDIQAVLKESQDITGRKSVYFSK